MPSLSDLYEMIPGGHDSRIQAADLAAVWGMSRREAERTREEMCMHNLIVCNTGDGYYRPQTLEEYSAYERYIHSYYKKLASKLYHIRAAKKKAVI